MTHQETGESFSLEIDEVIINHGYEQDAALLDHSELSIERTEQFYIAGNATCESSVEGIYAAGDILMYEGKVNLIAGAFQDAANAVNKAKQFIQPDAPKVALVSSHIEVFQERNQELVKQMIK